MSVGDARSGGGASSGGGERSVGGGAVGFLKISTRRGSNGRAKLPQSLYR